MSVQPATTLWGAVQVGVGRCMLRRFGTPTARPATTPSFESPWPKRASCMLAAPSKGQGRERGHNRRLRARMPDAVPSERRPGTGDLTGEDRAESNRPVRVRPRAQHVRLRLPEQLPAAVRAEYVPWPVHEPDARPLRAGHVRVRSAVARPQLGARARWRSSSTAQLI